MNKVKYLLIGLIISICSVSLNAQSGGPPPPPGGHGSGNDFNSPGGGAPIGSGVGILLVLGAAYGGRKIYKFMKERESLDE